MKAVAALTAAPLVRAPDFKLVDAGRLILPSENWFANARELRAYDINRDTFIIRTDILCIQAGLPLQLGVSWMVSYKDLSDEKRMEELRRPVADVLAAELRNRNVDFRTIRAPLIPGGWVDA